MNEYNPQNISDRPLSLKEKFQLWLVPILVVAIQRFVGITSKRIDIGRENIEGLMKEGNSWIYAIWHTNVLFSPYLNRGQNVAVMISSSRDGEFIARVVERLGNSAVRGSSSRGGISALKEMISLLRKGYPAAFTPDGPRGPAFRLQQGIVIAAQRSGVPIVPFHYECTRQWIAATSWDQHRVPKPFTTFVVSYGTPIYVAKNLGVQEFEEKTKEIENALLENMQRCREKRDSILRK